MAAAAATATVDTPPIGTTPTTMRTYRPSIFPDATNPGTACNPHGIDNILNKRDDILGQRSSVDKTAKSVILKDREIASAIREEETLSLPHSTTRVEESRKQHVQAWSGFQGIINNPAIWRDRTYLHGKEYELRQGFPPLAGLINKRDFVEQSFG